MDTLTIIRTAIAFIKLIPLVMLLIGSIVLLRKIPSASTTLTFIGALLFCFVSVVQTVAATLTRVSDVLANFSPNAIHTFFMSANAVSALALFFLGMGVLLFALNLPARRRH